MFEVFGLDWEQSCCKAHVPVTSFHLSFGFVFMMYGTLLNTHETPEVQVQVNFVAPHYTCSEKAKQERW